MLSLLIWLMKNSQKRFDAVGVGANNVGSTGGAGREC